MKLLTVCLLSLTIAIPHLAYADDIYGQGDRFIKITEVGPQKELIKFEICLKKSPLVCDPIGTRSHYLKSDLARLRNSEKKDIALAALADAGIIIFAFYGGAIAGAAAANAIEVAPMVGASAGVISGITGATTVMTYVDAVNPVEQYRQVVVLSEDVIQDRLVKIKRNIEDIAYTLNTVLSNID